MNNRLRHWLPLTAAAAILAVSVVPHSFSQTPPPAPPGAPPAAATPAPAPTNLKVFPANMPRPALIQVMRRFSSSLGVKCNFCHVESGGHMDFASDANPHKDIARAMVRMTKQIDADLLPAAGVKGQVSCWSCHRGATKPETEGPPEAPPANMVPGAPPAGMTPPPGAPHS